MNRIFERSGLTMQYPEDWKLELGDLDGEWVASFQSPHTAFMVISYHPATEDVAELLETTLRTLKEVYPTLEHESVIQTIAGSPAPGHDMDFFELDLTNTCRTRCLNTVFGCFLLMMQCSDDELESNGVVMETMWKSIVIAEDDD